MDSIMPTVDPERFYASTPLDPTKRTTNVPVTLPPLPPVDTPYSRKLSGYWPFTSMHVFRDERMQALGSEMRGKFAGPVSVEAFLKRHLPIPSETCQSMPNFEDYSHKFAEVAGKKGENDMYKPMVHFLHNRLRVS
jgi:hypothetical protein